VTNQANGNKYIRQSEPPYRAVEIVSQDMPSELTVCCKSQFYDQMAVPGALKTSVAANFSMHSPEEGAL